MLCVIHCVACGDVSRAANGTGHGDAMGIRSGMQCSTHAILAPTESSASIKLAGGAEEATIVESKALVLQAKSLMRSGLEMPWPPSMGHGACSYDGYGVHSRDGHGTCSRDRHGMHSYDGHGTHSRDGHDAAYADGVDVSCPHHVSSPLSL
jgi:hypothetical protein